MLIFTNTDKTLMMRAARHLSTQAAELKNSFGQNWAFDKESRNAKREYDRLLRDERDLRALAKRLETAVANERAHADAQAPMQKVDHG